MKKFAQIVLSAALVSQLVLSACSRKEKINPDPGIVAIPCFTQPSGNSGRIIPGEYIVTFRNDSVSDHRFSGGRLASLSAKLLQQYKIPANVIKGSFSGIQKGVFCRLTHQQAEMLRGVPEIAFVEPDRIVSIAACITAVDSGTIGWGTKRVGYADGAGTGRTVWIIDSGVDTDHPDLQVDVLRSRSFLEGQTSVEDQNGHGTHVAGIIGAKNNAIGTLGVASGANLVAVKVLDQLGEGRISTVIKALTYIKENANRGDVVNMSLVVDTISKTMDREVTGIADKGIMFAIAAGNSGLDAAHISPARVNHPNVFTVSAMDEKDNFVAFSNFGKNVVDLAAPGVSILSTNLHGTYASMSGTSLAAPHVAGLLLLDGRNFAKTGVVKNDPDGESDPIAHKQ